MSNNKFKVLVVEDEANICSFIETLLETNGYQALVANTCAMGQTLFTSHNPDLIILDLGLPDRDGLELIRFVRQKFLTPIVVLSARTTEQDKIEALDLGANDYLTKPFGVMELISRVKALLRRSRALQDDKQMVLGDITLDSERREVHVGGELCELTFKEFELLKLLMVNAGIVLHRDTIMSDVWGTDYEGESRTLDMHIKTLRQKLGEAGNMIKTVRNVGYKME